MTRNSDEPTGSRALVSLSELARDSVSRPTRDELDQGLRALRARVAASPVRERVRHRWLLVGTVAALLMGLGIFSLITPSAGVSEDPRTPLAYQIEGGTVLEGGYLREWGQQGIHLLFNEGSRLDLLPRTRGMLRSVDQDGARVAIEHGTASFQITPNNGRRWLVEVGPFLVTVKGTEFTVVWDPASEQFELKLRRGRVVVSGPVSGGDLSLRAGQRLVVNLAKAETVITEDRAPVPAGSSPAQTAAPDSSHQNPPDSTASVLAQGTSPPTAATRAPSPIASTVPRPEFGRRWALELAGGHWNQILNGVEQMGIDAALNSTSSEDLFALAGAARYGRRTDLARAALLAQRRRFPDSPRALDATFLLGRVDEARGGATGQAIAWYEEYLTRAPKGPYAAEALGRRMTITEALGGSSKARPIAEEYLRRFPNGSYAGSARAVLRAH